MVLDLVPALVMQVAGIRGLAQAAMTPLLSLEACGGLARLRAAAALGLCVGWFADVFVRTCARPCDRSAGLFWSSSVTAACMFGVLSVRNVRPDKRGMSPHMM